MAVAVIGLIGVALGALMAQAGAILTDRRQSRTESVRWRRDQKAAAYDGALRHLLRAANRRSKFIIEAGAVSAVISQEDVGQIFDDLVEAQFWVHVLATRCGAAQVDRITGASARLDEFVDFLVRGTPIPESEGAPAGTSKLARFMHGVPAGISGLTGLLQVMEIITECAREDGGASTTDSRRTA
jgi:hypothetical protein